MGRAWDSGLGCQLSWKAIGIPLTKYVWLTIVCLQIPPAVIAREPPRRRICLRMSGGQRGYLASMVALLGESKYQAIRHLRGLPAYCSLSDKYGSKALNSKPLFLSMAS